MEKTYNYNFPLNRNTLNGKSNQKTIYAPWKSDGDDVVFTCYLIATFDHPFEKTIYEFGRVGDLLNKSEENEEKDCFIPTK